jgi:CRISPR-associated endonuclease/helicase Cas3
LERTKSVATGTIRIPTGFGKTAGVVVTWLYHRVARSDERWPRRLVFCLPMRVLVEQTVRTLKEWLSDARVDVGVHVLMGGADATRWVDDPDKATILVGTQDMLLSRALNRGYGARRPLWPMEYGLLHQDALWVLDEVQLMDVGLATTAQLGMPTDRASTAQCFGHPAPSVENGDDAGGTISREVTAAIERRPR